ncbi:uncharacterized protein [Ptychodera flava]|uniref:uncharacterized protein n=1 Tax=Ptychodera flava TaxID=63121 RepID=UPI00396A2FDA
MHMILLGNIVVARKMVVLLDCTEINGIKKFTYYGDITCDIWWWYPLVVYLMAGVVPLFLVVMHESKLLERKQIGHKRFLAACIIPLPFTVWWLVQSVRRLRKRGGTDSSDLKSETKTKYFTELEVIQAPFQDGWRRFWEGALLFSRLLLLFCHLLIADILHRSLALMLVCVLIVIVHLVCQPFWSKAANCANILSLILLVLIAGFNFIDVLSQSYVLSFAEPEGPLNHVLEWLELAFVLLPFAIIVCAIGVGLICRFIVSTIKRKCSPSSYEKLESSSEVDSLVSDKSVHRFPPVYEEQHQNDSRGARPANKRTTSSSVLIDSGYQTSSTVSESNHRVKRGSNNKEASRPEETASAASSQRHSVDFSGDLLLENSKQLGEDGPSTRRGDVTTAADVHCSELECGPESPRERHLEVYNWRDDQAYILACLDQFNNIVSGLKDPGLLSSTNFTTNVFAAGQFDHEGGHLTVEQSGVNLFIPPGALSEHDEPRRIFVCVSVVDREYPCLTGNQTALTAVVRCGPQGLKFQKHVLLSIKHCTTPTDVSGSFKLWSSDTALSQPMKWCNASESGKALCICQGEDAISFISELSNFFVAREVNSMSFKMGGFFTRVSDTSTKLRIRLWRATAADTEIVNVKESSLRGRKISTDCEVLLHKNGKSLHVKLENLSSSWKILDDPIKIIPYDLIWQRSHNTGPSPVVTFLLETRRQGLLETPLSSSVTVTDDVQSLVTKFDVSEVNEHVV